METISKNKFRGVLRFFPSFSTHYPRRMLILRKAQLIEAVMFGHSAPSHNAKQQQIIDAIHMAMTYMLQPKIKNSL